MKKIEKAIAGVLGGTVLAAFLFISDDALAYEQFTGTEGKQIKIKIKLPTFPHEARQRSKGFKGVRYEICTRDGTAKGAMWSGFLGGSPTWAPDTDYLSFCGIKVEFTSHNNYSKSLKLTWPTADDDVKEDNEYFWIDLTNPQVIPAGRATSWHDWNGSHHVPSKIEIQAIIEDND